MGELSQGAVILTKMESYIFACIQSKQAILKSIIIDGEAKVVIKVITPPLDSAL